MTRSIFGWDLPPGCSHRDIDEAYGTEMPCSCCGHMDCICPECPKCGESGNDYCYEHGHLTYSTAQLIGRSKLHILELTAQLDNARWAHERLVEQRDAEDAAAITRFGEAQGDT